MLCMLCKGLKHDTGRNLKKANKGTTTVVVNSQDKSASPMVTKTNGFVKNKKSVLNSTILHLHKLTLVGRTIISGCIKQLQPIAQQQKSQKTLCFNGCDKPVYKSASRGGNAHSTFSFMYRNTQFRTKTQSKFRMKKADSSPLVRLH